MASLPGPRLDAGKHGRRHTSAPILCHFLRAYIVQTSLNATTMQLAQNTPYLPASTPRSADVVLYLDLDGVVHHEAVLWHPRIGIHMSPYEAAGHALFEWVPLLEAALEPYPAVALVLSSTWCIRPGYSATLKRLPQSLRSRFIGGTFHKRVHGADPWTLSMFRATPRGVQVMDDAVRRKPRQWIALDDDLEDWPEAGRHHVVAISLSVSPSASILEAHA